MPGPAAARATGREGWPLVGRGEEIDRFADALGSGEVRAAMLHGPAGVGKTRLADEFLRRAASEGRVQARATATAAAATVPLGAIASLLPSGLHTAIFDPVALYAEVAGALRERAGGEPFVLFIDDLPLLDPTSQFLVTQLLDAEIIFLVATVRSGETLPDAVAALWRRDDVVRFDLSHLSRDDVSTLLHLTLEGPVDAKAVHAVWDISGGNALFVRELILGAQRSGNLVERDGTWSLAGPLTSTARLNDLVESRIGSLAGPALLALDALAMWEPMGLVELESIAGVDALEEVDEAKLIDIRLDGRRQQVLLSHPLFGEALRERVSPLRRRRLLLDGAARIEAFGARRREDVLRIATARMEGAGSADPVLLTAAARLARYGHDFPSVERLARASLAEEERAEAMLLLGEALHELGAYEEAEQVLAGAERVLAETDERLRLQLLAMRVRNLLFGLQRMDEAAEVNRRAYDVVSDPQARHELVTDEATILLYSDRPLEALEALERLPDDIDRRGRVLAATVAAPALVSTGRCDEALLVAQRAFHEHTELGDQLAIANPGIHLVYRMYALTEAGRLDEASELASAAYEASTGGGPPIGRVWWAQGIGRSALLAGRPETARRWLTEAATVCSAHGFDGPRRLVLSFLAVAQAWLGQADAARAAADQIDALAPWGFLTAQQELGRGWAEVAAGNLQLGREHLLASADSAAETGNRTTEAWLLHDVARLGGAALVSERLRALERDCQGALVPCYALHARALAESDGRLLDEASRSFEATGAILLAAEAGIAAAHAYRRAQLQKPATSSLARATRLTDRCEGARTPALVSATAVVPLTPREREIGLLAASGVTSREIAERLYVSVRTVDNHLQSVYSKLGVSGRLELADALGS